jgi:hypothetical protein
MEGYVGQPLQAAMARNGPPDVVFDMPDGRRAFQWVVTSEGRMPTMTTTNANIYAPPGAFANVNSTSMTTGGGVVTNTCRYTMYAEWRDNAWIFTGFEPPRFMCQ